MSRYTDYTTAPQKNSNLTETKTSRRFHFDRRLLSSLTDYCSLITALLHLPRNRRHLQLANRLRDLNLTRTGHRAVERGVTARDAACLADNVQTLRSGLVAAVENEAMCRHQRGGAEIIVTGPERRAGGGAGRAQNALRGFIEAGALLGALQPLLPVRGKRGLVDEPRQNFLVIVEEWFHVHDQVFDDLQSEQRLDSDLITHVTDEGLAGQHVASIDA